MKLKYLRTQELGKQEMVALLGPGDFFGEAALIDSRARNASVRARTDLEVVVLGRSVFSQMSTALLPLADAVASAVKRRANTWKVLGDYKSLLDNIALRSLIEAPPSEPFQLDDSVEFAIARINP